MSFKASLPAECNPAESLPRPRIFVDCTQTHKRPVSTGIPRVVTNIVKHGRPAARERGADLIPVRFLMGHFLPLHTSPEDDLCRPRTRNDADSRMHWILNRLRTLLAPKMLRRAIRHVSERLQLVFQEPLQFTAGDVLLLPDSSWAEPMWPAVDQALADGAILGIIQHDFIPIRNPDLVPADSASVFRRWTDETLRRAHYVMAVSRSVAAEAREELTNRGRADVALYRVSAFRNGADLPRPSATETIRKELIDFIGSPGQGPYLTVGTIEPRKNQATLLAAIDRVLQAAPDARFLIAGIVGWKGKPIAESIRRHPGWPQKIRHFSGLSDAELQFAYKHAKAVVFPSLAEGYGLPIVESLAQGTRVFASDIPVHREIGGVHCVFFDPFNAAQLADLLVAHSLRSQYDAMWPPVDYELPSWSAAAAQIVEQSLAYAVRRSTT